MVSIVGAYQHESNENLDEYFKAVGVPYIPRKMMCMSSPRLEISNNCDKWTIRTITMIRTAEVTFTLGEEYEEHMPAGVILKNVTTMEGDNLVTVSVGPDNNKVVRKYEITKDGVVLIMTHEKSGQVGKRYFKRLS
ncbi:sodium/calcium exchanger regulatory protein 1-like [Bombus vosnesenskii]|uniref:Sodium/calcium exchanger regulatory protein 1-like n=4 Tax=Pyrobombus TaxID=144703 RepID=A0A6J3KG83_9HYME|nr:sodium/calcium exchanger regulatory protein 1-like isoform X2 [Bombus vancouverensis nearcticus]XP_033304609.1 sodium/calcium exchanger regulatory protein 1-like [Bombus bifarius]XP_033350954.1 sodium/calcium exchanger regulatory protein 1-like [Bombus vosnesenskii]XP_050475099.1 sodium/calcium exchanger regulatory protein 1-like isoform X2 [Bombus huntii]